MVNSKSENIKRGEQQYESIKQSMSKIRNGINKHLDNLEEKLCKEADTVWSKEKLKLTGLITEIEEKMKKLQEMQDDLKTVTEHTSKLQSFLGIHLIEQKVHQCQRYIEDSERSSEVDIKLKQNNDVEKVLSKVQSFKSLGEVKVVKIEISLKRQTSVSREAQVNAQQQINITNITMNFDTKWFFNMRKQISDMICLMDDRVIVVEQGGKVNLLTSDGNIQTQLPISGKAWGVTQINHNTIAITYPGEIKIFDMKNKTVTKVIQLHKSCFGLSFANNCLAVGMSKDEIRIIHLNGNTLKSVQVQSESQLHHLVYCNDRVIYSDYVSKAVYCVDGSGQQIWQYKKDLLDPRGLCTDTCGNIFVADNIITALSKDGQNSQKLGRRNDNWGFIMCICFNKNNESSGFISDHNGIKITRFNVSYD
ncbi:uncharacterized protein LOC127728771 [Mytilus californianus]|uniref:uncharacterized protein LOC127728771 n=1 Tax=Mytilus californianus TaxID=6549 RepID=UPI0022462F47|nr:uncharacterized protein LOC127728771 [Mytilus californianus]